MESVLGHNYGPNGPVTPVAQGTSATVAINAQAELIVQVDVRDATGKLQNLQVDYGNGRARLLVVDQDGRALLEQILNAILDTNVRLQTFLDNQSRLLESNQ